MHQTSTQLNTPQPDKSVQTRAATRASWFRVLRQWLGTVLQEQRTLDEQVTAPLLRRYRQQNTPRSGKQPA